jgi:hypothetical protein
VHAFVSSIFDCDLRAKRIASLADATVGALQGRSSPNLRFGLGMAEAWS